MMFLHGRFLGRVNIVIKLLQTYEKLHCKGEPYRSNGQQEIPRYTEDRLTSRYFYRIVCLLSLVPKNNWIYPAFIRDRRLIFREESCQGWPGYWKWPDIRQITGYLVGYPELEICRISGIRIVQYSVSGRILKIIPVTISIKSKT